MSYSITIQELIKRPIIRTGEAFEYLNKMTVEETQQFEREVFENVKNEKEVGAASMAAYIDRDILYNMLQRATSEQLKAIK